MSYMTQAALSNGVCPCCGQALGQRWHGVKIFAQSRRILQLIEAAGRNGITSKALFDAAYRGTKKPRPRAVQSHIWQIRKALKDTEYQIRTIPGSHHSVYKLVKVVKLQAFE